MAKSTPEEIAWAAGFFEGEGSFYFCRYRYNKERGLVGANLTQKNLALVKQFRSVVGFGNCTGPYKKGIYIWRTTKKGEPKKLLELLQNWLSPRRICVAETLITKEKAQVDMRYGYAWNKGKGKKTKDDNRAYQREYYRKHYSADAKKRKELQ